MPTAVGPYRVIPWFYNQGSICEIVAIDQTRFYICFISDRVGIASSPFLSYHMFSRTFFSIATSPSPNDRAILVSALCVDVCVNFLFTSNNECGRSRVCGIKYKTKNFSLLSHTVFDRSHVQVNVVLATITQEVNGFSKNKISSIQ